MRRAGQQRDAPRSKSGPSARVVVVAVLLLAGGSTLAYWAWAGRRVAFPAPPPEAPRDTGAAFADFVGTATCATCHPDAYAAWRGSTHGRAGGAPTASRIIAPFDGRPLHFKDAVVIPAVEASGEYTFTVREQGQPAVKFRVSSVVGGGHLEGGGTQTFFSAFPDGTVRFLPFDYSKSEGFWFCNTNGRSNRGAVPVTPELSVAECGDWPPQRVLGANERRPNCQQCHGSQILVAFDTAGRRYRTQLQTLAVNCESCHGPGRRHVELARQGELDTSRTIGLVALDTLSKDQSVRVCLRCHSLKERLESGYLPGQPLEAYFALKFPALAALYFPDGRTRVFAYQAGHLASDCYVNGSMTCVDCHDPHTQRYRDIVGEPLAGRFNDGQCVDCHPSKAPPNQVHTHHRPESDGSRCTSCHMPYRQPEAVGPAVRYGRSDHTIPIPRPSLDAQEGAENACHQCHRDRSTAQLEQQVAAWYGTLKPPPALVTGMIEASGQGRLAAARLLLQPDPQHPVAAYSALNQFRQEHLYPDMPALDRDIVRQLERLARNDDRDVRALALASLHLARGQDPAVRRFLARALSAVQGADARGLRNRWAQTLLFWADRMLERGEASAAIATLRKAEEIRPRDPAVFWKLGIAATRLQELDEAVRQFRHSLELDPDQPLVLSDLAMTLTRMRDVPGALTAAEEATTRDPWDAEGFVSLGYAHLQERATAPALAAFRRAVTLNPGLASGHMGMAQALDAQGDRAGAVAALQRVLDFQPGNVAAQRALASLRAGPRRGTR